MFARLAIAVALTTVGLAGGEPSTAQLVNEAIRHAGGDNRIELESEPVAILRTDPHRDDARAIVQRIIGDPWSTEFERGLELHWVIFGEELTESLLLEAAGREPSRVLRTLSRMGEFESGAIHRFVVDALSSDDVELRHLAVGVPGDHGQRSVEPLIELLRSPSKPVWGEHRILQNNIHARIRENGSRDFLEPLLRLTEHPPSAVRGVDTLMALSDSWGEEAKLKIANRLRKLFDEPSTPGRLAAAEGLAALGDPTGTGLLLHRMLATTRIPQSDRQRALVALVSLLDETPAVKPPLELDLPQLSKALRVNLAERGWPVEDTRLPPIDLTPADEAIFESLDEGGFEPLDFAPSLTKQADHILANPPTYIKGLNPSTDYVRLAAGCYEIGDRKRAALTLDLARRWGGDDVDLIVQVFRTRVIETVREAVLAFAFGDEKRALDRFRSIRGGASKALAEHREGQLLFKDLRRRESAGSLGRGCPEIPSGFSDIPVNDQISFLIDRLENLQYVDHFGHQGRIDFTTDERVAALIALGDQAVPALIDCVEKDRRLTRSLEDWRPESRPTFVFVCEPALQAIQSILRVDLDVPVARRSTGRSLGEAKRIATRLRSYWDRFGHMSLDERMMHVLQDPQADSDQLYEAARNLSTLGSTEFIGTPFGNAGISSTRERMNPAIEKFKDPTAAEAILAGLDRALESRRQDLEPADAFEMQRFAECLGDLGDARITPELRRRWLEADNSWHAWPFVIAATNCGDRSTYYEAARAFAEGNLELRESGEPVASIDGATLETIVESFIGDEAGVAALNALVDRNHPYFSQTLKSIANADDPHRENPFFRDPVWFRIALEGLADERTTGRSFWMGDDGFVRYEPEIGGSTGVGAPDWLEDLKPATGVKVQARQQDLAAVALSSRLPGMPRYHLLSPDREQRLARIRSLANAWQDLEFKHDNEWGEAAGLGYSPLCFVPMLKLDAPATQADVDAGQAAFATVGSTLADLGLPLPAKATIRKGNDDVSVIVFQAETIPAGETLCGVLGKHRFEAVPLSALADISPIESTDTDDEF